MIAHVCAQCGTGFETQHSTSKFCSRACSGASRRIARPCEVCGQQVNNQMRGKKRFCSHACATIGARRPVPERFWPLVARGGPDDCWLWLGATNGDGYGKFAVVSSRVGGKPQMAHRVAYELLVGQIPAGLELDHTCETTLCVNPAHLDPVTHAEHAQRTHARRRPLR